MRTLVDSISAMVAYWDSGLRCRFANKAYQRWFGVSPEWLIGKHISELLGPIYRLNLPYIEGALRGEPQEFEREIPNPAGGPPRQSLAQYIPDLVDGEVRGFFVLVTDVTAIKQAELALRESEERFRTTIDEAPIGMALVATDGRFSRVNRALCEIVGYTTDELTGLTFQAITHPEDLDADLALAGQLARGEIQNYKLDKRYIRKDGTIVDITLSGSAVRGVDGAPLYYIAQIEDVRERKRVEREQRFLAEMGPVLATTLDYQETLTRVAELAVRELADLCVVELLETEDEPHVRKVASRDPSQAWLGEVLGKAAADGGRGHPLWSVLETRRAIFLQRPPSEALGELSRSEAHRRAALAADIRSMMAVPLVAHGKLLGAIAFLSSSKARVYGADEARLAEELAQRAALSIENARLYRAARRATQARDEVLGIVAHDLRNPLNNIVLQAALLRTSQQPECPPKPLATIERAATRMNRLIEDLLDVTRIEAGRLSLDPKRLAVEQVVNDCFEAQKPLADAASIELRLEAEPGLPEVSADRDRLLQVLENLVGNALKFNEPGGSVTIAARAREGEVLFSVTDTGCGIPAEALPHLFDRFWQAKGAERAGAGLGLAIAKGLIEAHGGHIWVESTPGQGSSFFFAIPTARRA